LAEVYNPDDPWYAGPPFYEASGRVTRLGLKRKRQMELVELLRLRKDANEVLPVLTEFPKLYRLRLSYCHDLRLGFLPDLPHLTELVLEDCERTLPTPLVLPRSLKRLMIYTQERRELERLCQDLDWSRVPDLDRLDLGVDYNQPPARLDLGFVDHLPALRVLFLKGVWHAGPRPSPLIPPFERLPPNIANGALAFESAHPYTLGDALRAHYGLPVIRQLTPEEWAALSDAERNAIEEEQLERQRTCADQPDLVPAVHVDPLRDPAPAPPDPDWMLYRADHDAQWPWWTSGTLAPADDPDVPEGPLGDELAATIERADPQLWARIDTESDSEETFIFAQNPEDLEAALRIAGLTSPGIAD
jgi:hypothetical protein